MAWQKEHWLSFKTREDPNEPGGPIWGCHCGFPSDESACGWGDDVLEHIVQVALAERESQ